MIKFNSEIGNFEVPTDYSELTFEKFSLLQSFKDDEANFLRVLTGAELFQLSIVDFSEIEPYIEFLKSDPAEEIAENNSIEFENNTYSIASDIGSYSWEQKIFFSRSISAGNILKCVSIYLQPLIDGIFDVEKVDLLCDKLKNNSFESVFSTYKYLEKRFVSIVKMESLKLKSSYTSEQIQAGIKSFDQLAEFNTVDLIAGGDVLKYDAVLKIDYNTIFNKLLKLNLTTIFEEKYNSILQSKK